MFDLFGIKARKKAKTEEQERLKLLELQEKKKKYQERKEKITSWHNDYYEREVKNISEYNQKRLEKIEKENSVCPKCGSKNIINKIKRAKGEVHGDSHTYSTSSYSSFLFGSSSYSSSHSNSKIDGELDTFPVNKCKDCGNEWNVKTFEKCKVIDDFSQRDSYVPGFLRRRIDEYLEMKYDPSDLTDPCNSLEEKKEAFIKKYSTTYVFDKYRIAPRYMLEYALYNAISPHEYFIEDIKKEYGYSKKCDKYSYEMPDELWEIVKKIIGWKGTEE